MPKRNHQEALQSSMEAELQDAGQRVPTFSKDDRFDRADKAMGIEQRTSQNGEQRTKASKIIRDTFSMLPEEHQKRFVQLKQKAHKVGTEANKSELVRAGLWLLDNVPAEVFAEALQAIEKIKTGRPALEVAKQ